MNFSKEELEKISGGIINVNMAKNVVHGEFWVISEDCPFSNHRWVIMLWSI